MRCTTTAFACISAVLLTACSEGDRIAGPRPQPEALLEVGGEPCDPTIQLCNDDPGGGGGTVSGDGIALGFSEQSCRVATPGTLPDADGDSINDTCEYQLAAAFAPTLIQRNETEAGWSATVSSTMPTIPGEYLFGVGKGTAGYAARVAYLPAYYKDIGIGGHNGDSEFIMIDLSYDNWTGRWYTSRVFLSSHCGTMYWGYGFMAADPWCKWYWNTAFAYRDGVRFGAPVVWVSHSKHANYASAYDCNRSHPGVDYCDGTMHARQFPIGPAFEILPVTSTGWMYRKALRATAPLVDPNKTEMFWDIYDRPFTGWQPGATSGASGYGGILALFGIIPSAGGANAPGQDNCTTTQIC